MTSLAFGPASPPWSLQSLPAGAPGPARGPEA
jgi:hypothetical protein